MADTEQVRRLQDALHERNSKLLFLCGWLRGTADSLPETSAETARRLARECYALGAVPLETAGETFAGKSAPQEICGVEGSIPEKAQIAPITPIDSEMSLESRNDG
jgi:hypothetical protein